jgi:hypothetical protein
MSPFVYHEASSKYIVTVCISDSSKHENYTGRANMLPRSYCNGFIERIARQQLGKHLPLVLYDNNGESNFVANVTVRC